MNNMDLIWSTNVKICQQVKGRVAWGRRCQLLRLHHLWLACLRRRGHPVPAAREAGHHLRLWQGTHFCHRHRRASCIPGMRKVASLSLSPGSPQTSACRPLFFFNESYKSFNGGLKELATIVYFINRIRRAENNNFYHLRGWPPPLSRWKRPYFCFDLDEEDLLGIFIWSIF